MATTDYIQTTESLLDFAVTKLSAYSGWTVVKHPGSDTKDLFKMIPGIGLPAAIVSYSSSSYANKPRRQASLTVVVAARFDAADDRETARSLMDRAISLIDGQVSNLALFRVVSDRAIDCGPDVAAYSVEFRVEDH